MSAKNNTTPIGDGSVGIDTTDAVSQQIQQQVSENNLKYQIGQNSSVKGVFNATVLMVSRWNPGDKFRILQEYGNVNSVSKSPSNDELNQAVATTLIANMPKEELKRIIGTEENKQQRLTKDVAGANAKSYALAKKYFDTKNAAQMMQEFNGHYGNDNQMLKMIKQSDKSFSLDKAYKKQYPQLRKELVTLLKGFTKVELANIAERCGVEFEDNTSVKNISNLIANQCIMYVTLILGKTAGISHNRLDANVVDEVERLLGMTSYAWVTGKVKMGDLEIAQKRKAALAAKKQLEINKKTAKFANKQLASKGAKGIGTKIKKHFGSANEEADGRITSKKIKYDKTTNSFIKRMGRLSRSEYSSEAANKVLEKLSNLDEETIRNIATSKGIIDVDKLSLDDVKQQLAIIMSSEASGIEKRTEKALKIKNNKKREKALNDIKEAKNSSVFGTIAKVDKTSKQDYSDKVPVVTFNENGQVASEGILKAVPVFIMGSANDNIKAGHIQSAKEAKDIIKHDKEGAMEETDSMFDELNNNTKSRSVIKNITKRLFKNKKIDLANAEIGNLQSLFKNYIKQNPEDSDAQNIDINDIKKIKSFLLDKEQINKWSSNVGKANKLTDNNIKDRTEEQDQHAKNMSVQPLQQLSLGNNLNLNNSNNALVTKMKSETIGNVAFNKLAPGEENPFKEAKITKDNQQAKLNREALDKKWLEASPDKNKDLYEDKMNKGGYRVSTFKDFMSEVANKTMPSSRFGEKGVQIQPVFDINRSHDYIGDIAGYVKNSENHLGGILSGINQIGAAWGTLQSAGLSMNMASLGGAVSLAQQATDAVTDGIKEAMDDFTNNHTGGHMRGNKAYTHFATGGSGRGQSSNSFVSNIVTGDHPQNKNNTELVSVDWASKNINVKPIPKLSTNKSVAQKNNNSNIDNLHRMSQSERSKPMSVGISTGIIKYSKQLSDVEDDTDKTAIKVYSINSGINEKIKIGENELSLFDAVYGIYSSVSTIANAVNSSNELLATISANTASTNKKLANLNQSSSESPFQFTSELDTILSGE